MVCGAIDLEVTSMAGTDSKKLKRASLTNYADTLIVLRPRMDDN